MEAKLELAMYKALNTHSVIMTIPPINLTLSLFGASQNLTHKTGILFEKGDSIPMLLRRVFHSRIKIECVIKV